MTTQTQLFNDFDNPQARRTDPETSHDAAKDALLSASQGRLLVMRWLLKRPMTDFELAHATHWQQTSIGKRRGECMKAGLVEPVMCGDQVIKRPAPSGSLAIVWAPTLAGSEWYHAHKEAA